MSINLKKRMTTGPATAFVSCTQLPIREDIIFRQDMVSYKGGGGGKGGKPKSNTLGDVVNLPTNKADRGNVDRQRQQLEGAILLQRLRHIQQDTALVNARQRQIDNFFQTVDSFVDAAIDGASGGVEHVVDTIAESIGDLMGH